MPRSDTWPGGAGLEAMASMDSAGSCDSVVSGNSGFSDDSLEHLSADEKACLMFLEETIEALDTEEDSGLSNEEPDQLPNTGNLAAKLADLSASMSKSKLSGSQKHTSTEGKENVETRPLQNYLVPTPLVLASSSSCSAPSAKLKPYLNSCEPHITPASKELDHKHNLKPAVPLEPNVVIPPPTRPRDCSARTAEGPVPRGPLSYDALVHLQRSASTKKTPLCPTIDHTIELDKNVPVAIAGLKPETDRSQSEASTSKRSPPAVAPKPKSISGDIPVKTQSEASITSDTPYKIKSAADPQVVRLEALHKLGLLQDPPENQSITPLPPPKPRSTLDPTANRIRGAPLSTNPSRSPSFCYSQVPSEPKNRPLQSSASFHRHSRCDQQSASASHPVQTTGWKAAGLQRSAALGSHRNRGNCPELPQKATAAKRVPQKPTHSVGYTVVVMPGMGADRKEALRKLGLLKN